MISRGGDGPLEHDHPDPIEIVRSSYPILIQVARRLARSISDAEDLVQEAFVETLSRYPGFEGLTSPLGYLATVVYRSAFRARRLASREISIEIQERMEHPEPDREAPAFVEHALASVGPRQRACIILRYLCDLDEAEIAEALGCRPSTVRSQIARGLAHARERVAHD